MKGQKGITIITLAITIVVLLILAGVSLNLVLGDNGIIEKAQYSAKRYDEETKNEKSRLDMLESAINQYAFDQKFAQSLAGYQKFTSNLKDNPSEEDIERAIEKTNNELGSACKIIGIRTLEQLKSIGNDEEYPLTDVVYIVINDINIGEEFIPIGGGTESFSGVFDGRNNVFTNLIIDVDEENGGLFGINDGIIYDLSISNGTIQSSESKLGVLAGTNNGIIENCNSLGNIDITSTARGTLGNIADNTDDYGGAVGGIAGFNSSKGKISSCNSKADITALKLVGGICGDNRGIIEDCVNDGNIECDGLQKTQFEYLSCQCGGIVGSNGNNTDLNEIVRNCVNNGEIIVHGMSGAGIAGLNTSLIENCQNNGNITSDYARFGGIVGENWGKISQSCNNAIIESTCTEPIISEGYESSGKNGMIGGICGLSLGLIEDCYTTSNSYVISIYLSFVGGICGVLSDNDMSKIYNTTNIERSYNLGKVTGIENVAGIVSKIGYSVSTSNYINSCYNKGEINGNTRVAGITASVVDVGSISNCYNDGTIKIDPLDSTNNLCGGIVAVLYGNLTNCYNTGSISNISTNSINARAGGIAGRVFNDNVSNCYYLNTSASTGEGHGTTGLTGIESKTQNELQSLASTLGSEYKNNSGGYPKLTWEE